LLLIRIRERARYRLMRSGLQRRDRLSGGHFRRLHRRRVWSRQKRHWRRGGQRVWSFAVRYRSAAFVRVEAPRHLCIAHEFHRRDTLRFLRRIRSLFLQQSEDIVLDFERTEKLQAPGALLFVAELDRAVRMAPPDQRIQVKLPPQDRSPEGNIVRQVLHQVGVLDLVGYDTTPLEGTDYDESVKHWHFATGTTLGDKPGEMLDPHEGKITETLMKGVWKGVSEALTNSRHHAYLAPRNDGCCSFTEKRWWMFSQERDRELTLVVCDLGIGIRRSLPIKWSRSVVGKLLQVIRGEGDLGSIRAALVIGQTRTEEENRGKGLPQIWNEVRTSSVGSVGIYSGRAALSYWAVPQEEKGTEYDDDILGTLITWTYPLEADGRGDGSDN
jgi:hypothetical protein